MSTKPKRNYHMDISVNRDRSARCNDCGATSHDVDVLRATQCSHIEPPCTTCGGDPNTNECKADCPEMLGLLAAAMNDPSVHVVGRFSDL